MDDLTENLVMSNWLEANALNKLSWDHQNATNMNAPCPQFSSSDIIVTAPHINQEKAVYDTLMNSTHPPSIVLPSDVDEASLISQRIQESPAFSVLRRFQGTCQIPGVGKSTCHSLNENSTIPSCISQSHSSTSGAAWPQAYMGGMPSSSHGSRQAKVESHTLLNGPQNSLQLCGQLCGKRAHMDNGQSGSSEVVLAPIGVPQTQQFRTSDQQASHGMSAPSCSNHTGISQPQGAPAVAGGTTRPRVRARRGQATDPHSIAERLRRERIADRMKALQELVPSVNKTDKALMLDEIIEYVKFLQLQVKILSMCRLSGTGAVVPHLADIPFEGFFSFASSTVLKGGTSVCSSSDNILAIEQEVAKLMEDSMGSALQFLQSKGLCLMPVSLATAMSSNNARPMTSFSHGHITEALSPSIRTASNSVVTAISSSGALINNEILSAIQSSQGALTQPTIASPTPFRNGLNKVA
ncbi:hypothetical protein KP509_09G026000 [Ceratopteris richardii]|nr:hypothetical protein KP509_09G026000 [Ceratopteris richardii]